MSGAPADLPAGRAACCSRSQRCWRSCSRPWPSGASRSAASPRRCRGSSFRERRRGADRVLGHLGRGRLDRAHGAAQLRAVSGRAGRDRQWHAVRPALGHADHLDRCDAGRVSGLRPGALAGPAVRAPGGRPATSGRNRSLGAAPGRRRALPQPVRPGDLVQPDQLRRGPDRDLVVDLHLGDRARHPAAHLPDGADGRSPVVGRARALAVAAGGGAGRLAAVVGDRPTPPGAEPS